MNLNPKDIILILDILFGIHSGDSKYSDAEAIISDICIFFSPAFKKNLIYSWRQDILFPTMSIYSIELFIQNQPIVSDLIGESFKLFDLKLFFAFAARKIWSDDLLMIVSYQMIADFIIKDCIVECDDSHMFKLFSDEKFATHAFLPDDFLLSTNDELCLMDDESFFDVLVSGKKRPRSTILEKAEASMQMRINKMN